MNKINQLLDQYQSIGWDFDETVYGGKNSGIIINYIVNNPEKSHHIITYRSGNFVPDMHRILDELKITHYFDSFHSCEEYGTLRNNKDQTLYLKFKPGICMRHDIEVLVDDIEHIRKYAEEYGVAFFNSITDF